MQYFKPIKHCKLRFGFAARVSQKNNMSLLYTNLYFLFSIRSTGKLILREKYTTNAQNKDYAVSAYIYIYIYFEMQNIISCKCDLLH